MDLKSQIEFYKRKLLLRENKVEKILAESYLRKARNNIIAMQVDYEVSKNEEVKKLINISGFKEYDWVAVKGYYAMYMASLACLAKLGLKSENHNATISAIEFYFVEKGKLERMEKLFYELSKEEEKRKKEEEEKKKRAEEERKKGKSPAKSSKILQNEQNRKFFTSKKQEIFKMKMKKREVKDE